MSIFLILIVMIIDVSYNIFNQFDCVDEIKQQYNCNNSEKQNYESIFKHLKSSDLTLPCSPEEGWTRVIVEKPFGRDLKTAEKLGVKVLGEKEFLNMLSN